MSRLDETRDIRLAKLKKIVELGYCAYPSESHRTHKTADAVSAYEELSKKTNPITLAGRIRSIRRHGGSAFVDINDLTGTIQIFISRAETGEKAYKEFAELIDPSDLVEFSGTLFKTKQGQITLNAKTYNLLSKSLRNIPEDHFGLKDVETRLRKRYLDLAVNPETRQLFIKKSVFWQSLRQLMTQHDFLEVETPVLEDIPGGAEAEPFITHHQALDRDFFLRISLELPLKRLLVGGLEKVFEIGRIFRNEGISTEHLQDYTQLEFYWAYADYNDLMKFVQELYRETIKKVTGSLVITSRGHKVDWGKPWKTYDYFDEFEKNTGLKLEKVTEAQLKIEAKKLGLAFEKHAGRGKLIDLIYKKKVRPKLIDPGFLVNPPVDIEPLAKRLPKEPDRVQRFQVMAYGTELGKGFSELNDPIDQRERFEQQMKLRAAGDKEAQMIDEDYLEAMEYGLPPAAGFGLSERLFSVIMDVTAREAVLFPPMKVEDNINNNE
ncbi:MAG: lysine--tRNA ligase [Patescibacteria group bacterium]|nr:lysine--tRNA ligase [Patescibacteria group bacterium]